jgi:acetoin utilization protein AcuB
MKVKDIMKRGPLTIREDDVLSMAQSLMTWAGIRHLPVLRQGKLTGILSDRDLLSYRVRSAGELDWRRARVRAAMHPTPQTAHPDDSLTEVAGRMATAKIGALPVVDKGDLVGIITTIDVLAGEVREAMAPHRPGSPAVGDAMTVAPVAAHPGDSLLDAAAIMAERGVRHLPVTDQDGVVVGMLSDHDLRAVVGDPVEFMRAREGRVDAGRLRVSDAMSHPAVTASPDVPVAQLAYAFADGALAALPVVDDKGVLIGVLSYVDVLRSLAGEF